jgi:hypothetical protein
MKALLLRGVADILVALDYNDNLSPFRNANQQQSHQWISGFRSEVEEICTLPGYCAAYSGSSYRRFGTTYRSHTQGNPQGGELRRAYYRTF